MHDIGDLDRSCCSRRDYQPQRRKKNKVKREVTITPIIFDGRKKKIYLLGLSLAVKYKIFANQCLKHRIEQGKKQKKRTIMSTPVVQFTPESPLGLRDVDLGEIANAGDLDIFRGHDEVDTFEGATTGLGTLTHSV